MKTKTFCGHRLTRAQSAKVVSLVEMTIGRFKVHKKQLRGKSEGTFWAAIHLICGEGPREGEAFSDAVARIHMKLAVNKVHRMAMVDKVDKAELYELLAVKTRSTAPITTRPKKSGPSISQKDTFYKSWDWRTVRMQVIKQHGRACSCCGAKPGETTISGAPVRIVVDHIKPLSKYWHLRLDPANLQILCDECNQGKGAWDETDWREHDVTLDDTLQTDALTAQYRETLQ